MFYVPTDSNDGPPPAVMKKLSKVILIVHFVITMSVTSYIIIKLMYAYLTRVRVGLYLAKNTSDVS